MLLGPRQEVDRPWIFPLRSNRREESTDCFNIVIQNLWLLGTDRCERFLIPLKVRYQHLNRASWIEPPCLPNRLGKDRCPAIRQFVTIHRCNDGMVQTESAHRFRNTPWFSLVKRERPPRFY